MKLDANELSLLKEVYERQGCVVISDLIDAKVLDYLQKSFNSKFDKRPLLRDLSSEYSVSDSMVLLKLEVVFNTPDFLQMMSEFTGRKIRYTKQRLYYIDATCVALPWHDDSYDTADRVAAIRFELSDMAYEGGDFLFKDKIQQFTFSRLKLGEGILFKVEFDKYYHMVSPVVSGSRKSLIVFLNV